MYLTQSSHTVLSCRIRGSMAFTWFVSWEAYLAYRQVRLFTLQFSRKRLHKPKCCPRYAYYISEVRVAFRFVVVLCRSHFWYPSRLLHRHLGNHMIRLAYIPNVNWKGIKLLGRLFLAWVNFNPSLNKQPHAQYSVSRNYLSIPKPKLDIDVWNGHVILSRTLWWM